MSRKTAPSNRPSNRPSNPNSAFDSLGGLGLGLLVSFIVATPLIPSDASSARDGSGVLLIMFQLILLAGWGLSTIRHERFVVRFCLADALVGLFAGWQGVSNWATLNAGHARHSINAFWQSIAMLVVYWLLRQWCRVSLHQRAVGIIMVGLATSLTLLAFDQYFRTLPRDRAEFRQDPVKILRKVGIQAPLGSTASTLFENRLMSKEPFATFALTNSLAGFLIPWLTFALGAMAIERLAGNRSWRTLLPFLLIITLISGCVLLTKSRSAVLGCVVGAGLFLAWMARQRWRIGWKVPLFSVALISALVIAAVAVGALDRQVITEATKSFGYRWEFWRATSGMIGDHLAFGCGLGNFQEYYAAYKLPESSEMVLDPHNFLLELAATGGLLSAILFMAVVAATILGLTWRKPSTLPPMNSPFAGQASGAWDRETWAIIAGGVLGSVVALITGLDAPPLVESVVATMATLGLVAGATRFWIRDEPLPPAMPLCAGAVLLVNLLAAGGISFPGVAISFWVLLALAINSSPVGRREWQCPRVAGWVVTGICLLALLVFWLTAYGPIIQGRNFEGKFMLAAQMRRFDEAFQQSERWTHEDPWAPEPYYKLAATHYQLWQEQGEAKALYAFENALDQSLKRDSHSHLRQRESGHLKLRVWRRSNDSKYLVEAIGHYRRATELYPNGSLNHAQLAWTLHLAGRNDESAAEAGEALRLDQASPHLDQKLERQSLFDIQPPPELANKMPLVIEGDTPEQRMLLLRNGRGTAKSSANQE